MISARLRNRLKKAEQAVVVNPKVSVISRHVPRDIRLYHIGRALQILQINQQQGRFSKDDFDVFVGPGVGNAAGDSTRRVRPPNTTRRSLSSLTPEWAEKYLPFPGRIYFTAAGGAELLEAVLMWYSIFSSTAIRSAASKNHPYRFSQSLSLWIDGKRVQAAGLTAALQDADVGTTVQIINVAPHAATVELWYKAMYDATVQVAHRYAPGLGIQYGFINSDAVGLEYGKGSGGPSRPGKKSPVVYALPMVTMFIPAAGRSNASLRPFGMWYRGRTKGGKPMFRKRARTARSLKSAATGA
jgi:hypothetical protein